MNRGAKLCVVDDAGSHLIHRAIQAGSIRCIQQLIKTGNKQGCSTKSMMVHYKVCL